jgi:hypothetical protein
MNVKAKSLEQFFADHVLPKDASTERRMDSKYGRFLTKEFFVRKEKFNDQNIMFQLEDRTYETNQLVMINMNYDILPYDDIHFRALHRDTFVEMADPATESTGLKF